MRVLTAVAVLLATGVGVAIPLLFGEDADSRGRELTRAEVERQLENDLANASPVRRRPDSVSCRGGNDALYECTATYRGDSEDEAEVYGYDLHVRDHELSPEDRQFWLGFLRFLLLADRQP